MERVYLITGASSDIGMAYINSLNAANQPDETKVIAHYRSMSAEFESLISAMKNISIELVQADLSRPQEVMNMVEIIKQKYSHPTHILHLAAGKFKHMRIRDFDGERTRHEMETQVYSLAELLKAFIPAMAKERFGRVAVMLTAYTVGVPPKFVTDYSICKHALLGLMKAAAAEYCDKGICINAVSPSMMETKFLSDIDSRIVEMTANQSPLGRNMSVDEIIAGIRFLMSEENSYMCGINLNLSGGETLV